MLRADKLCLARGGRDLVEELDWLLDTVDRVGLIGANGAGKTSLLRLLVGEVPPDSGRVLLGKGERVGYLPQEGLTHAGRTLLEEANEGMETISRYQREMEAALESLHSLPHDVPEYEDALHAHEHAEAAFRAHGGYSREGRVGQVLRGLGFQPGDLERDCGEFSGGWQMRIALAKLLLEGPEVLLLDEPTNHLDIESRIWLEHFLESYPGALVVVSHDRSFLDRVVRRVCEITGGKLISYSGTFSAYLAYRAERLELLRKAHAEQQEEIQRVDLFIRRFRAKASKASQVQSRVKMLEKMERIVLPATQERVRFRFPPPPRSGPFPLALQDASKAYGPVRVLEKINLSVAKGERLCLAGPNGAGKSTLLRLLAGRERPTEGSLECDRLTRIAYFAQDQAEELPPDRTVLEMVWELSPQRKETEVRSLLGSFLFRGDDVYKRCAILSGGERSRVALARILLCEANMLLLDEPTNHLDIQAKETLLEALQEFAGTVVFVSHDRDFTGALAEAVVEVGAGDVARFECGFEEFLWKRAVDLGYRGAPALGTPAPDLWFLRGTEFFGSDAEPASDAQQPGDRKLAYEERRKLQRKADALRRRVADLEGRSAAAVKQVSEIDRRMANPDLGRDFQALAELQREREQLVADEEARTAEWSEALELLEEMDARLAAG